MPQLLLRRRASTTRLLRVQAGVLRALAIALLLAPSAAARSGGSGSTTDSPSNLKAIAVSSHEVKLGWFDVTVNELGLEVVRSEGTAPFTLLVTLPPDTWRYDDATVKPRTTYSYRVRAILSSGPSLWSNVATVTTPKNHRPKISCSLPKDFELRTSATAPPRPDHFTVTVSDEDDDLVSLRLLDPMPGVVFTPMHDASSPATMTLTWPLAPSVSGTFHLLFEAHDSVEPDRTVRLTQRIVVVAPFHGYSLGSGLLTADVTGDGVLDVIGNAALADVGGVRDSGAVYVWAGGASPSAVPTATLTVASSFADAEIGLAGPQGLFAEDVTGDGVLDVIAVSHDATVNGVAAAGAAFVWSGGPGLAGAPSPTATLVSPNPVLGDYLGIHPGAMFVDLDGDGATDVLFGSGYDVATRTGAGKLFYWRGGASLVGTPAPDATLANVIVASPDLNSFGSRGVDFVDLTGDGRLDVVVSASGADSGGVRGVGLILIFDGQQLSGSPAPVATLYVASAKRDDHLGTTRCAAPWFADVTGDGVIDVISAASDADLGGVVDAGAAYVWVGGSGLTGSVAQTAKLVRGGALASDELGDELTVADLTGDGILDVVVGSPSLDRSSAADVGGLYVFEGGSAMGGTPLRWSRLLDKHGLAGDQMALALLEDLDGDGILDVVLHSPVADVGGQVDAGGATVWLGGAAMKGNPDPDATLTLAGAQAADQLEFVRRAIDADGDGRLDLLASARFADVGGVADAGAGYVFSAGNGAWSGALHEVATLPNPSPKTSAQFKFGDWMQLGDVTGDGGLDVVVALPHCDRNGVNESGAVFVFVGGATMVGTVAPFATLDGASASNGDRLGDGLQLLDLDGDGFLDVTCAARDADPYGVHDAGAGYAWLGGASLSGTIASEYRFASSGAAADDALTADAHPPFCVADVTGDGALDFLPTSFYADWNGLHDVGVFHLWQSPLQADVDPDVTLYAPGAAIFDMLGY